MCVCVCMVCVCVCDAGVVVGSSVWVQGGWTESYPVESLAKEKFCCNIIIILIDLLLTNSVSLYTWCTERRRVSGISHRVA